jgi:hypothetical protein
MSEIPMRPDDERYNEPGDYYEACIDHEHAVAKRAVEALRAIRDDCPARVRFDIDAALRDIDASGWVP